MRPNASKSTLAGISAGALWFAEARAGAHCAAQAQALWLAQVQGLAHWHASAAGAASALRTSRGLPASAAVLLGATITGSPPSATPP